MWRASTGRFPRAGRHAALAAHLPRLRAGVSLDSFAAAQRLPVAGMTTASVPAASAAPSSPLRQPSQTDASAPEQQARRRRRAPKGSETDAAGAPSSSAAAQAAAPAPATPTAVNFSEWYFDVIAAGDLIDAAPVKGTVILKPSGYAVWEGIQRALDARIKATGHVNAYFPLLVPMSFLAREAQHVEGFAKECAVVTHHRLVNTPPADGSKGAGSLVPDPEAKLAEPLIVRPTSETVIWDAFSRWVQSHRDLPLLLNQWANVVRWEMRTRPFLRTSEFLWQEGHTAHASETEAKEETAKMLGVYADLCRSVLAMPVVPGAKSRNEQFAGAEATLTCEAMMQNGWALQAATSHYLGTTFSQAFKVKYRDSAGVEVHPWGTSWGASTRLIGGVIMTHSDASGLLLPPAIAPVQVVLMPLLGKGDAGNQAASPLAACEAAAAALRGAGLRVAVDTEVTGRPGQRRYHWEHRGVPLRLEVGPAELVAGAALGVPRVPVDGAAAAAALSLDERGRLSLPMSDPAALVAGVTSALQALQQALYSRAQARLVSNIHVVSNLAEMQAVIAAEDKKAGRRGGEGAGGSAEGGSGSSSGSGGGADDRLKRYAPLRDTWPGIPEPMFLVPWTEDPASEAALKAATSYTVRCYPFADPRGEGDAGALTPARLQALADAVVQPTGSAASVPGYGHEAGGPSPSHFQASAKGQTCVLSGRPATHMALLARAY